MKTVKQRLHELEFEKKIESELEIVRRASLEIGVPLSSSTNFEERRKREDELFSGSGDTVQIFMEEEEELWKALRYTIDKIDRDVMYVYSWELVRNASPIRVPKEGVCKFSRWLFKNGEEDFVIGAKRIGLVNVGRYSLTENGGRYSYDIGFAGAGLSGIFDELRKGEIFEPGDRSEPKGPSERKK